MQLVMHLNLRRVLARVHVENFRSLFLCPQAWDKAAQLADAYKVGRAESAAALNLCKNIDEKVAMKLFDLVKTGFPRIG